MSLFGYQAFSNTTLSGTPSETGTLSELIYEPPQGAENVTARISGEIRFDYAELYTIEIYVNDGVRFWLNGIQQVDQFAPNAGITHSFNFQATAGQRVPFVLEYLNTGDSPADIDIVVVRYSSPSQPKVVVPAPSCHHSDGRDISEALEAHLSGTQQTPCYLWLIEPKNRDGSRLPVEGYTSLDIDVVYNPGPRPGVPEGADIVFRSEGGAAPSEVPASIGLSVDSTDVTTLLGIGGVTRARLMTNYYRDAGVTIYLVNYEDLSQGHVVITAGRLGKADIFDTHAVFELVSWSQMLNRPLGRVTNTMCQWEFMRGHCRNHTNGYDEIDPFAPDDGPKTTDPGRVLDGVLTTLHSATHVQVTGIVAPDDFATFGRLRITEGEYDGAEFEIKRWKSSGEVFLSVGVPFLDELRALLPLAIEVEEGCEHTWLACQAKENTANYGGQPYLPTEEDVARTKEKK